MEKPPLKRLLKIGFTKEEAETCELFQPVGCTRCRQGYAGRFALLETMPLNEDIQRMVIAGKSALDIKNRSILEHGMVSLRRCAILNSMRGNTAVDEVLRTTMPDEVASDGRETKVKQKSPA